ncbi:hypothetical protein EJB05_01951, partial [Eragrostis curvula]
MFDQFMSFDHQDFGARRQSRRELLNPKVSTGQQVEAYRLFFHGSFSFEPWQQTMRQSGKKLQACHCCQFQSQTYRPSGQTQQRFWDELRLLLVDWVEEEHMEVQQMNSPLINLGSRLLMDDCFETGLNSTALSGPLTLAIYIVFYKDNNDYDDSSMLIYIGQGGRNPTIKK